MAAVKIVLEKNDLVIGDDTNETTLQNSVIQFNEAEIWNKIKIK